MSARLNFIGQVRGVDATTARCNFRRFPLPVSGTRAPVALSRRVLGLVAIACLAAGMALGLVADAWAALPATSSEHRVVGSEHPKTPISELRVPNSDTP